MLKLEKYCSNKTSLSNKGKFNVASEVTACLDQVVLICVGQIISIIVTFKEFLLLWELLLSFSMTAPDTVQTVQIRRDRRPHLLCDMIMPNLAQ